MGTVRQAFIGAGSNLGDRFENLSGAYQAIATRSGTCFIASSSVYETLPQGKTDQPLFLNTVIGLETKETPEELLRALLEIEQHFGRVRRERWGPRTLDLDLLLFEDELRTTESLQLPHPRMWERAFVLVPLQEIVRSPKFGGRQWQHVIDKITAVRIDARTCQIVRPPFPAR